MPPDVSLFGFVALGGAPPGEAEFKVRAGPLVRQLTSAFAGIKSTEFTRSKRGLQQREKKSPLSERGRFGAGLDRGSGSYPRPLEG